MKEIKRHVEDQRMNRTKILVRQLRLNIVLEKL